VITAAYIFFGVVALAIFAFGTVFRVADDMVVVIVAASVMSIPFVMQMISERKAQQSRAAYLRRYADRNGWPFDASDDLSPHRSYAHLAVFERGDGRTTRHTMHCSITVGSRMIPVLMGDYDYRISVGRHTKHYEVSYLVARLPRSDFPKLIVRRERALDRIKSAFGFDDIDFESKAFSDRFFVGSSDKRFAYRLITPRMMEFLMQGSGVQGPPAFSTGGEWVGVVSTRNRWSIRDFDAALRWMHEFMACWPTELLAPSPASSRVHSAP